MNILKGIGVFLLALAIIIGLSYGFGWIGVHQTATIGKAKQEVQREVFENTNSFVKSKRQEAIKYYKEYHLAETDEDKKAIEIVVSMSLADFDEDKYITDVKLHSWIKEMKY